MATYTLAFGGDLLLAAVPDGGDVAAAVAREAGDAFTGVPAYTTVTGCILTNRRPDDGAMIVFESGSAGWLSDDENDCIWRYAVRGPETVYHP
jgi:hypothetical protein